MLPLSEAKCVSWLLLYFNWVFLVSFRFGGPSPHLTSTAVSRPTPRKKIYALEKMVSRSKKATVYGSTLADGRLSSKYPFPSISTCRGILMLAPLSATPDLKVEMSQVSWSPVSLCSFPRPYWVICFSWVLESLSTASLMALTPPSFLMLLVEKLVWAPVPFQSPLTGFGSKVHTMPMSSPSLWRSHLEIMTESPSSRGPTGPTWYSHWPGMTSALIPLTWIPALMQASRWASARGLP
mmetsp:Transcript_7557/g.21673  ORF Transcript_7557/g.21673 Transcript_7557/m.21673 type:complete len:238 (+) Transcript_7557:55-768(+)